jgi:rhodanese-related sulfurtransferase
METTLLVDLDFAENLSISYQDQPPQSQHWVPVTVTLLNFIVSYKDADGAVHCGSGRRHQMAARSA